MMRVRFDAYRVRDKTAHQAGAALRVRFLEPLDKRPRDQLQKAAIALFEGEGTERAAFCRRMHALGPPSYHPTYMLQHGMGAIRGSKSPPLVDDFDPAAAWRKTVDEYGRCGG